MKRFLITLVILIIVTISMSFSVYAQDYETEKIWDATDTQTREYLLELGIDEIEFEKIFNLSPTRVIGFLFELCFEKGIALSHKIILIIVTLIVTAIGVSFLQRNAKTEELIYYICALSVMTVVVIPVCRIMVDTSAAIKTSAVFVNAYLPVMTAVIIASKNPALAVTYNSFSIFLSSLIANVGDRLFVPSISALLSFNFMSSFSFENYRDRIIKTIRRMLVIIISFLSTIYTGLLTTQSILATSSDSLALKGIRFISGAFVPVVGGAVGDAISSVFSSFAIMKNTLGVFVIIVIILINLPVIIELLIWYFSLGLCSMVSSLLHLDKITDVIDGLNTIISIMNITLFFVTFVLVISTGVIIMMGR